MCPFSNHPQTRFNTFGLFCQTKIMIAGLLNHKNRNLKLFNGLRKTIDCNFRLQVTPWKTQLGKTFSNGSSLRPALEVRLLWPHA